MRKYNAIAILLLSILIFATPAWAGRVIPLWPSSADAIYYDNSTSGLTASNTRAAIDEIVESIAAYATSAGVSDLTYDADTWNGATTLAPSQNAVRDKIEGLATVYQPLDSDLTAWAGVTSSANGRSLVSAANYAAMRTLLDLEVGTDFNAYDADLTTYAGITPSANIQTFLGAADYAAMRTQLGLVIGTNVQAYDYDLGSLASGITGLVKGAGNGGGYSAATAGTDYLAGTALSDNAYGAGWDSDTTHTATKNAVYDAIAGLSSTYQGLDSDLTALAGISGQRGDILYYGADGWTRLAKGTATYVLTMGENDPAWAAGGSGTGTFAGLTDMSVNATSTGPVIWDGATGYIAKWGAAGTYLKSDGTWATPAGAGDMLVASYPHIVAIEALAVTDGNIIVGNGTTWVAESGATARASLGLAIGTDVQAYDADLTTYAGITPSANIQTLLGSANFSDARTNLGLAIGTNVQAYDADLTTYAGITPSTDIQGLLGSANYSTARTNLGLAIGTNVQAYDADLASIAGGVTGIVMGAGNGSGFSAAVAGTDYVGLASANTLTGNNTFGNADTDTLTLRSLIVGGNSRAVWIAGSAPTPTYATGTNELYVAGDIETPGTVYANQFIFTGTGDSLVSLGNNTTITGTGYQLFFEGGVFTVCENGTERLVLRNSASATLTGTSWNFAGVTNFRLPTADADTTGEISINATAHQLKLHDGNALQTIDWDGQVAGYVLKTDGAGNWTVQADATAGSPVINTVGDATGDAAIAFDASEEIAWNYTGNFTTGSQFLVRQLTGNPSGGVLFQVRAADTDITLAKFGDDTNDFIIGPTGNISLAGTALATFGGVIMGDSSPDASGEYGYASNAFLWFANSEDMLWTAGTNTWTYSSNTGANLVLGTPSATSLTVGALTGVNSIDATGAVDMDYGSADITDHTFVSDGGTVVIDGSIASPANISAVFYELADGSVWSSAGIDVKGTGAFTGAVTAASFAATRTAAMQYVRLYEGTGSGDNYFDLIVAAMAGNLSWTLPTAAAGGNNYLLNVDADGTMGYTDPSTLGGGSVGTFTLTSDADAGDYNITSVDRLEGIDAQVYIDLGADGLVVIEADTSINLDSTVYAGDGTYSFGHSPTFGVEGILEVDGAVYLDSTATIAGLLSATGAVNLGDGGDLVKILTLADLAADRDYTSPGGEYIATAMTSGISVGTLVSLVSVASSTGVNLPCKISSSMGGAGNLAPAHYIVTAIINGSGNGTTVAWGGTMRVMPAGLIRIPSASYTTGAALYLSTTGTVTATAPTTSLYNRQIIGYAADTNIADIRLNNVWTTIK